MAPGWKIYGEGPSTQVVKPGGMFNENKRQLLTAEDVRISAKGNTLHAFITGWPNKEAVVQSLGMASPQSPGKIANVELLGHQGRLTRAQEVTGLRVELPAEKLSEYVTTLKVVFVQEWGLRAS
jgi:alpha-L-fucosidase